MNTENLSTLKIHKLTQKQYDRELAAGNINKNEVYLTPVPDKVVDQTYNPESENAQSGTAVAEATSKLISLEDKTQWIFNGGNASSSVNVNLVIDDEMSSTSNNLVSNKIIKEYVDEKVLSIKNDLVIDDEMSDESDNLVSNKIIKKYVDEKLLSPYPPGSIYMSVNNINPASLFGGTWQRIEDTFLLACGVKYTAGDTGGEAEHKLKIEEMPSHKGHLYHNGETGYWDDAKEPTYFISAQNNVLTEYGTQRPFVARDSNELVMRGYTRGGDMPHNNMPPYLSVYMWQRIA